MNTVIKHPQSLPLVILRHEYLELTGNHCAAKLLSIFEFWTSKLQMVAARLGKKCRDWIYKTLDALHGELMGEHGINAIRNAIAQLLELGFIDRRHDERMPQNRTYQYRLNVEALQRAVDNLNKGTQVTDASVQTEECIVPEEQTYIDPHPSPSPQTVKPEAIKAGEERLLVGWGRSLNHLAAEWRLYPKTRAAVVELLVKVGLPPDLFGRE